MYIQLMVILFMSWFLILKWRKRHYDRLYEQLKVSAPRLPLIGHLYLFFRNAEGVMRQFQLLGMEAIQCGGVTSIWMGTKLYIHVADSQVADNILKSCLEKDEMMKCFHIATGDGSVFADVKTWRPRRKYMAPTFNLRNLNCYVESFSRLSDTLVDNISKDIVGTNNYSMRKMYELYSLGAIFESLNIDVGAQEYSRDALLISIENIISILSTRLLQPWLYHDFVYNFLPQCHTVKRHVDFLNDFFTKIIRERRQIHENKLDGLKIGTTERNDVKSFIDLMLESPANVSDLAIREESIVLVTAASDTTSIAIGFVTVMLARHPDVQEKLYKEIKRIIGEVERPIRPEDLPRLKYLIAVIKETIRLYPPFPLIVRKIDKNIELPSGVTLLPECGTLINIWAINRNPTYWGQDADVFRPERFLDSEPRHPAAFASFSVGPRNCVGYQYGMMSIQTVVAKLILKYRLAPAPGDKLGPVRLKFDVMMRDVNDYRVRFEKRK